MENESVAKADFKQKKGERYKAKKPTDSGLLANEGQFTTETQKALDYVAKKGERYEIKKPEESDIWQTVI